MLTTHRPFVFLGLIVLALMIVLALGASRLVSAQVGQPPTSQGAAATTGPNLLANPNFQDAKFYWRFPNSFVADYWYRYWYDSGDLPEFLDGGSIHHQACYPPTPGKECADVGNSSQGYIRMGGKYIAGVWQLVQATPCMDYQFQGYVRTDSTGYHPKVGINQLGWTPPARTGDYSCHTGQAPPMLCYKEALGGDYLIPDSTVWSSAIDNPAYVWTGPITVVAEALNTTITVWTNTAPDQIGSQSTYWDYMSLYQVPRQTPLAPNGLVLVPDLSLNPTVITGTTTQIQWTTDQPAFSQVYYRLHSSSPVSPTALLTHTIYLPVAARGGYVSVSDFTYNTAPAPEMTTNHSATLSALEPGATYDYMIAVRSFNGSTCATTGSPIGTFTTP